MFVQIVVWSGAALGAAGALVLAAGAAAVALLGRDAPEPRDAA